MTQLRVDTAPPSTSAGVRLAGVTCLAAGVLGAASGVFLAVYPGQVPDDMYSYPLTPDGFTAIQVWFFVQHLGLLGGLVALGRAGVMRSGPRARWGTGAAVCGMAGLAVTELLAITARSSTYPGEGTGLLDTLYGVSTIGIGVGLVLTGLEVRRLGRWTGWRGLVVLVTGVFVFVPMTPALMGPFLLARLAITVWMLLFAAIGFALWKGDGQAAR